MTFIAELMIHFGVGAATLTTKSEQASYRRGTDITGIVRLRGGVAQQQVRRIFVTLQEFQPGGESMHIRAMDSIAWNVLIVPDEVQAYPFTLNILDSGRVSTGATGVRWRIAAEAEVGWTCHPRHYLDVQVLPQEEIVLLGEALQSLGFVPIQPEFTSVIRNMEDRDGEVTRTYAAPAVLHAQITHATLQVRVRGAKVVGHFILEHREAHLRDYVQALTGKEQGKAKREFLIKVPRTALLAEDGKVLGAAVLQEALNKALVLPDNPQNWLLRGASRPPASGDTLLRPAQGVASSEADTLLRADNADARDQDNNQDIVKKAEIIKEAEQEAHQALYDAFVPVQIGYGEIFDEMKQKILKEKYGVDWQPPKR